MSIRTLEQLLNGAHPTDIHPAMSVLPAYTYPTDEGHRCEATALGEGQSVRGMAMGLLNRAGFTPDVAKKVFDALVDMPMGANLPSIVSASRNEKDLIPLVNWFLSGVGDGRTANAQAVDDALERLGDLMRRKFDYETTMNVDLTEVQRKYPTLDKLAQWLDAEAKDNRNIKLDKGGYNFPDLLAYSDDKVDVYKASNPMEAIALSKGYTFCIGLAGGNNMFYSYRNDPQDATAYFAWFKGSNGEKTHNNMCVVHVGSDGRYRVTDYDNSNDSPVVNKATLLKYYPLLKDALESGKLTADPYTDDEKAVSHYAPMETVRLNDETKALTPTSIAILIGKGCVFSDEFFDYVWEEVDKGRYKSAGYDSLIRKYVLAGFARLSEHQMQVLEGAGLGKEAQASMIRYKRHWVQEQLGSLRKAIERKAIVMQEQPDKYVIHIKRFNYLYLYSPLDKPIEINSPQYSTIYITGNVWDNQNISNIRFSKKATFSAIYFSKCQHLASLSNLHSSFDNVSINGLQVVGGILRNFVGFRIGKIERELVLEDMNLLESLEGFEGVNVDTSGSPFPRFIVRINGCPNFVSFKGFPRGVLTHFTLTNLPKLASLDYIPYYSSVKTFQSFSSKVMVNLPKLRNIKALETTIDYNLKNNKLDQDLEQIIDIVFDNYDHDYAQMQKDYDIKLLNKLLLYRSPARPGTVKEYVEGNTDPNKGIYIRNKELYLDFEYSPYEYEIDGRPIKNVPYIAIYGHTYLDFTVKCRPLGCISTAFYTKLRCCPKKIEGSLLYENVFSETLERITPKITKGLHISNQCIGNLKSLKGIHEVGFLDINFVPFPPEWITSLIDDNQHKIGTIRLHQSIRPDKAEQYNINDCIKAVKAYLMKHPETKLDDSTDDRLFSKAISTTESLTPCHTLMHTLNAVSEGWMDKVSGFLDKVDPDRSKMRGLAKTALALAGGGELDDLVGLIKDRSTDAEVDDDRATDILREVSLILGKTDAEVNQFTRLPEKERTERVKKALQDVIYRKYKMNRSEGRAMERLLYRRIKDALWNKYKCTLGESITHNAKYGHTTSDSTSVLNESLSKPLQSPDWYNHTTHHIKVSHKANTGVSEGLPPTVNFEGEVMELTTTESDAVDTIVANVQRLIERDLSEQDLESPEFKKELAKMCMRFANSDKRTAKKAFIKILKNFIQK